jgi:hypothetical protein
MHLSSEAKQMDLYFVQNNEFFCILLFELQQNLEMFWRWCRNAFSNVAKQGIILLLEPPFVFNPICQAVERERERERALHLGEIGLNYINSVQIVVDRQRALARGILLRYVQSNLRAKNIGLRFENLFLLSNFVEQN